MELKINFKGLELHTSPELVGQMVISALARRWKETSPEGEWTADLNPDAIEGTLFSPSGRETVCWIMDDVYDTEDKE